ncbi:TOMM precursor leader peptide-binding protein [Haloarcula amylolytica]|uniref:TOMM precursor leader peptide-binding protein n=1 Tax=Haloarcula amylolytica TaxID=396317 RepID=UPI003C73E95C
MTDNTPPLASYPRINPAFSTVVDSDDEITFRAGPWNGPVFEIADEDGDGRLAEFVAALDGSKHVTSVFESFDEDIWDDLRAVLVALQEKGIVRDAEEPVDDQRARLGGYLSLTESDEDGLEQLSRAQLTVVGAGEAGRTVARTLLESGVGGIDYVDLSADADDWAAVRDDQRFARCQDPDLTALLEASTFAVMAVDRPYPSIATTLNEAAHETGTPWTIGVVNGVDGQVGPTTYPGETACYECFRDRASAATGTAYREYERSAGPAQAGLPAFAVVVSGLLAADVVEQLTGRFGITTGSVVDFDFDDFAVQADEVLRIPHCETCGRDADRFDSPRHVTVDYLAQRTVGGDE